MGLNFNSIENTEFIGDAKKLIRIKGVRKRVWFMSKNYQKYGVRGERIWIGVTSKCLYMSPVCGIYYKKIIVDKKMSIK